MKNFTLCFLIFGYTVKAFAVSIVDWKYDGKIGIALENHKACFYSKQGQSIQYISISTKLSNDGSKQGKHIWESNEISDSKPQGKNTEECVGLPSGISLEYNIPYVIYMQDTDGSEGMHVEHFCIRKMGGKIFIAEILDKQLGNAKVEFFCSDVPLKQKVVKMEEKRGFWERVLMFLGIR